jgi:hypothetical protein
MLVQQLCEQGLRKRVGGVFCRGGKHRWQALTALLWLLGVGMWISLSDVMICAVIRAQAITELSAQILRFLGQRVYVIHLRYAYLDTDLELGMLEILRDGLAEGASPGWHCKLPCYEALDLSCPHYWALLVGTCNVFVEMAVSCY